MMDEQVGEDVVRLTVAEMRSAISAGQRWAVLIGRLTSRFIKSERANGNTEIVIMQAILVECLLLASHMALQTRESFVDQAATAFDQVHGKAQP